MSHDSEKPPDYTTHGKQLFEHGRQEFLDGRYFEAHDIWEELWQRLLGSDRRYLQGLIHLTVGAYHFENGNARGARSQWKKAALKIGEYPKGHWGIDVSAWLGWIGLYLEGDSRGPFPTDLPFQSERFPSYLPMSPE
jgi:uncharacterized protein